MCVTMPSGGAVVDGRFTGVVHDRENPMLAQQHCLNIPQFREFKAPRRTGSGVRITTVAMPHVRAGRRVCLHRTYVRSSERI